MTQLSLLDVAEARSRPPRVETPAARSTDPETSHEAATAITGSGKRARQQRAIVALVRRYPGRTAGELAKLVVAGDHSDLPDDEIACYQDIQRRFNELEPQFVHRGDKRRCTRRGTMATELLPAEVDP